MILSGRRAKRSPNPPGGLSGDIPVDQDKMKEKRDEQEMRSNGFGSFIQEIFLIVPFTQHKAMKRALGHPAIELDEKENRAVFKVEMKSTRKGDDETVVWILGNTIPQKINWTVDWERSEY